MGNDRKIQNWVTSVFSTNGVPSRRDSDIKISRKAKRKEPSNSRTSHCV